MDFDQLSVLLNTANEKLYRNAVKAVNINITIRNWLFGFYIVEFEQNGEDRADKSSVSILGSVNQEFNNAAGQFLAEIIKSIHT